ncbi:MAG: large-conductance mechanosensitive channel protein MscL [Pedobacter sp.]|nr:MAG: large-conductance mechanosensitive channel protein MscL [Pedobacter sp.]
MSFIKEFKEFAIKGNVMDLAIGVIIGGAFGKIVSSLIDDIITPAVLSPALKAANLEKLSDLKIEGTAIAYGNFLSSVITFIVVALVLFSIIKTLNRLKRKEVEEPAAAPAPSKEAVLLTEIRDLLRSKN